MEDLEIQQAPPKYLHSARLEGIEEYDISVGTCDVAMDSMIIAGFAA